MTDSNVLDFRAVKSARSAAKILRLNNASLFAAMKGKIIRPQARIEGGPRDVFGFSEGYLADVAEILPKKRGPGVPVFSKEVIEELKALNAKWAKRFPEMGE